jgi:hypothetical protein
MQFFSAAGYIKQNKLQIVEIMPSELTLGFLKEREKASGCGIFVIEYK